MSTPARGLPTPESTACFSIQAATDPGLMPRVIAVFARRGLVPSTLHAIRDGRRGEETWIDVQIAGLEPAPATLLAEALRQIVGVDCVLTSDKRDAMIA